jgi:hypothetical protein
MRWPNGTLSRCGARQPFLDFRMRRSSAESAATLVILVMFCRNRSTGPPRLDPWLLVRRMRAPSGRQRIADSVIGAGIIRAQRRARDPRLAHPPRHLRSRAVALDQLALPLVEIVTPCHSWFAQGYASSVPQFLRLGVVPTHVVHSGRGRATDGGVVPMTVVDVDPGVKSASALAF